MNDELKKLGLRVRLRAVTPANECVRTDDPGEGRPHPTRPGKSGPDERGNAKYRWQGQNLLQDGLEDEYLRYLALHDSRLALIEEPPADGAPIRCNPAGLRVGYDPYESGLLTRRPRRKKTDLRELSRWVQMKRRIGLKPSED
ncbi:hypothetical protein ACG33_01545 [Steroidobacter denitrificans]|uniref:Uncharacterized protein n=1 Tax=Steroidobacter denitrificans TaxID=465721 RepID=A0A127F8C3_STEDE|nr:hypothetical protein [Steroidobacter denitrificans]AMN45810.1 hypothetical protein ACG33_01545 [Steroidobacter denitrificans]